MEKESAEVATTEGETKTSMTIYNQGRFMLPMRMIEREPGRVAKIFAAMGFVPVRAEIIDFGKDVDYVGLSPMFRKLPEDECTPHYKLTASFSEAGQLLSVVAEEVRT